MPVPVRLFAYDLSGGLAAQLSLLLLGEQIEAVWHTSIVVHDREYYFGQGVSCARPGGTHFGAPLRTLDLGTTAIDAAAVDAWIAAANAGDFAPDRYNLLHHNCNHFAAAFSAFLTGENRVPSEYTAQGDLLLRTPLGAALAPSLGGLEAALRVREPPAASATATADRAAAAIAAATGRAALADADADVAAGRAPASAAVKPLAAQEAAVAADVAAGAAGARAEFEALVRAEFDAARAAAPGMSANEAAALALDRATAALRAQKAR